MTDAYSKPENELRALRTMLDRERAMRRQELRGFRSESKHLKPYHVKTPGPSWWVAAFSIEHARAIVLCSEMDGCGFDEMVHEDVVNALVDELTLSEMDKHTFHDGDEKRPMSAEFDHWSCPGIMACSEY